MKLLKIIICLILLSSFLSGCFANARGTNAARILNHEEAKNGSPYRWVPNTNNGITYMRKELIGTVAATAAKEDQKAIILTKIKKKETSLGRNNHISKIEVRYVSRMNDIITEIWLIGEGKKSFAYRVAFNLKNNVDVKIYGPW